MLSILLLTHALMQQHDGLLATDPFHRLAVIKTAPEFTLRDQNEKPVRLADYRGKVVVVGFIFTTCNGACPATTHRMTKVQQECARRPELADRVQFLSVSLDPERDTPEALRGYMRLFEIKDGGNWSFLTGTSKEVASALGTWGMWARPAANGQLDHPSRVFLVDPGGKVREIYNLEFFRQPWVLEDIIALLQESRN
jgi:protein SCO1/2